MARTRRDEPSLADALGRIVRGLLTVAGSAAFGIGAGAFGAHGALTVLTGGIKQDGWGAAPVWLFLMAVGGTIGLIVGLVASIRRVRYQELAAYRVFDWLGLLLGIAAGVGLTLLASERYFLFFKFVIAAGIVPPCAMIGRSAGGLIGAKPKR